MNTPAIADALKAARHWPWDPKQWPFRVLFTRNGTYYGRFISDAFTFATEQEAREFIPLAATVMPKGCKPSIQRADEGASGWNKTGRWVSVKV